MPVANGLNGAMCQFNPNIIILNWRYLSINKE